MPDAHFADPRLARLYDPLEGARPDLDAYADLVAELGARRVVDIGCGTGTLATMLAARGLDVVGVDPAAASLDVARSKPFADRVRWVHGDATATPDVAADLVLMTGNVAQVFVTDDDWAAALAAARAALRPGGHLVFETRDPARRAWEGWNRAETWQRTEVAGIGTVESWGEVTAVDAELVSFTSFYVLDGQTLTSDSTLRFRGKDGVIGSVERAGLVVAEIRDAPDRPGKELVFVCRRPVEGRDGP
ncbi:class I SAM-dependent DNA methyltransferase [Georgenia alba]|uniref:Class I SAM-dependent DNA methyltransferase n=1 Tax=Georgenia alba TaxID=2233858 RepID=A0ABW2Q6B1_9MICO